jgi:phospholipid/cholesterol/gamma-HCH transport system substrate-binding protein
MIESVGDVARKHRSVEAQARWIFAAIVLLVGAVAAGWFAWDSSRYISYELRTHDSVSGLIEDAPVEFHGVEVGRVARIELTGPASVRVVLHIRKDAPVSSATVATITSRGLASKGFTGYVYVALEDDGSPATPMAAAPSAGYPQLRTAASRSLNMDTAMNQVNQNVQSMTRLLQAALDAKTMASLKESVDSVQKVARTLDANTERMNTILANAERATARLGPLLDSSSQAANAVQRQLVPQAYQAFANLDRLSTAIDAQAQQAASRLQPLLESSNDSARTLQTQVLPEAYEAISNLNRLSTSLRDTTARIERDPSVLIRGTAGRLGPGEGR